MNASFLPCLFSVGFQDGAFLEPLKDTVIVAGNVSMALLMQVIPQGVNRSFAYQPDTLSIQPACGAVLIERQMPLATTTIDGGSAGFVLGQDARK